MSELEHALREALADPPVDAASAGDGLADIEHRLRRRQRRRRTGLASLAAAAVVAAVVPVAVQNWPSSQSAKSDSAAAVGARAPSAAGGDAAPQASSGAQSVPAAVRRATDDALQDRGAHPRGAGQWVETTVSKWWPPDGDSTATADSKIYVIQLRGHFVCTRCRGLTHVKGNVELVALSVDPKRNYGGISVRAQPADLSKLGTVHTFTLR